MGSRWSPSGRRSQSSLWCQRWLPWTCKSQYYFWWLVVLVFKGSYIEDAPNVTERSSIQPFHPRCGASWTPQIWFPSKFDCSSDHHLQPVDLQVWLPKLFQGLGIFCALVCRPAHWGQPHWIRLQIWFHHFHIKKRQYYRQYCLGQGVWQEHVGGDLN